MTAICPKGTILLLAGVPACGKTTFAQHLKAKHGFEHIDMEHVPAGWPHPDLHDIWEASRSKFVGRLRQRFDCTVLDWGFPPECQQLVDELRQQGVRLIWFDGDIKAARTSFCARSGSIGEHFDLQVAKIVAARFPNSLGCDLVRTLSANRAYLKLIDIERAIFGKN